MSETMRIFLSIDIDDSDLLLRISNIQTRLDQKAAKMKLVERENIHFTWRFFGDTSSSKIEPMKDVLCRLSASPFEIRIRGVGAFPGVRRPRVIWIGVSDNHDKMCTLKNETDNLLSELGYSRETRKFHPHATIARVRRVHDRDLMQENLESLAQLDVGTMVVSNLRLTKSTLTPSGPIYETIWEIELE
jgi:2'-5' RNA ligase